MVMVAGSWLNLMILKVFSNFNDSMILFPQSKDEEDSAEQSISVL